MWSERSGGSSVRGAALGRGALSLGLSLLLLAAPAAAQDADPAESNTALQASEIGAIVFDFAVLRTLGALHVVVGSAFFLIAGPLSAPGGGWSTAWDVFVLAPYEETFERGPGRF